MPSPATRQITIFAVCLDQGTRRSWNTCRAGAPSVRCRLGSSRPAVQKHLLRHVPGHRHTTKLLPPSEAKTALDGRQGLPCAQGDTQQKGAFAVRLASGTRQTRTFAVCLPSAHGKQNKFFFTFLPKFFYILHILFGTLCLNLIYLS